MACLFRILLLMSSIYTLRAQAYHGHCPRAEGEHGGLNRIRREVNTELQTMNDNPKKLKQEIRGEGGGGGGELETKVKVEPSIKIELKEESTTKIEEDELHKKPKDNHARNIASAMNKYYKRLRKENATDVEQKMNIMRQKYEKEYKRVLQLKKLKKAFKPRNSTYNYIPRFSSRPFKSFRPFNASRNRGFARSRHPFFNASRNRGFARSRHPSFNASRYESHSGPFNTSRYESYDRPFDESRNREFDRSLYRALDASRNRQFDRPRHPTRSASHYRPFDASGNRKFDRSHNRPFDASRIRESDRPLYRAFNASHKLKRPHYVLVNDSGHGLRYLEFGSLDGTLNSSRYRGSKPSHYGTLNTSRYRGSKWSRYGTLNTSRYRGSKQSRHGTFNGPHYSDFNASRYRGFTRSRISDFDRSRYRGFSSSSYSRPQNGSPYDSFTRPRFRGANISRYRWSDKSRARDLEWKSFRKFGKSRHRTGNGTRFIEINGSRYRDLAEFERFQRVKQLKGEFRPGNASDQGESERSFRYRSRDFGPSRFSRFNRSRHHYDRRFWQRSGNGTRYIEINGTRYRNMEQFERVQRIKQLKGEFRPGVNEERWSRNRDYIRRPGYRNFSSRTYRSNYSGGRRDFRGGAGRPPYGGGAGRPPYGGGAGRPGYGGGAGKPGYGRGAGRPGYAPKRQFRGGPGRVRVGESVEKPDYGRRDFSQDDMYNFIDTGRRKSRYGRRRYNRRWDRNREPIIITSHPLDQQEVSARKYWFRDLESVLIEMKKDEYERKGLTLSPEELNMTTYPPFVSEYDKMNKWQRLADLHSVRLHVHFTPRAVPRPKWNSTGKKKKKMKRKKVKKKPKTNKKANKKTNKNKKRKGKKKVKKKGKGDKKSKKVS